MLATVPVPLTAFIGREHELADVTRLLADTRLLTLTGAGGSGKTRLAIELARRVADDGRPIGWVELASLVDAAALPVHVALALGIRVEGASTPEQAIVARVNGQPFLLVLDNCEHLVAEVARLADGLLMALPSLTILATSREALGVSGERGWLVPPLAVPAAGPSVDLAAIRSAESVRLFVARARDVSRTFALTAENMTAVARIVRRVDGLPLALELAAARAAVLTPAQIADRLDDRFALLVSPARGTTPRQRTLRSTVDWSYDLLVEEERVLLERLSVFAGGFTLDAAEAVCAGDVVPTSRVLDVLAALATKSLLAMEEDAGMARYRLLETIRDYARERRHARGRDATLEARHAAYFVARAKAVEQELELGRPARMREIDVEHDNILAALSWSADVRAGDRVGLPLVWSLLWYWFHRQLWSEGFAQAERALATADMPRPELRAAALHALGLYGLYGRDARAAGWLAEAQALWTEAGNTRWQVFTRLVETVAASLRRDVTTASRYAAEMLALSRSQPDAWCVALAKAHGMVPVLVWQERFDEAAVLLDEALEIYESLHYAIGIAYVHDAQAYVALQLGDVPRAVRLAARSLRDDTQGENRWLAGRSLRILGAVADQRGDAARAATLFGAADAMYEAIGAASLTAERAKVNNIPARLRASMPAREFDAATAAGRAMHFREALAFALDGTAAEPEPVPHAERAPEVAVLHAEAPVVSPALDVRTLGQVRVYRHGEELPPEAFSYAKPRELLLYLLSHPAGRTREQVGLDFWPELSAAQVKNNFHVTLHHLRKALGDASLIRYERGRYRVTVEADVAFDADRFEAGVTAALARLRATPGDQAAADALDAALALHTGAFLEEEPAGDWHLAVRDRLSRRYEDGLDALATYAEGCGDHARAAEACRRLLVLDPTHESVAVRLMRALALDGRRTDALAVYERLTKALREELDDAPAPETSAVAESIRQGRTP